MLQNWLKPLPTALLNNLEALPPGSFGKNLLLHTATYIPDLKKVKVAIIGIGDQEANEVRTHLYSTMYAFSEGSIADLGNLRKADAALLIPVIYELLSGKVLPIVLGNTDDWARAQFLAYQEAKVLVNLTVIDERFRASQPADTYTSILSPRHALLFHYGLIGYQIHQILPASVQFLTEHHFDALRLGRSRASIEETEPILRDADTLTFHLAALKQSESPGVEGASPSGFTTEEACQLCRYAGMSDKLSSFGIYGYQHHLDRHGQTAQVIAQMIWYFLEGFFSRKGDYPVSTSGLTEYIVDFRKLNYQLTFWKSTRSGRWWMQVPVPTKRKHERHRLVPCSYQDYQAACREELPERLMQAMHRF